MKKINLRRKLTNVNSVIKEICSELIIKCGFDKEMSDFSIFKTLTNFLNENNNKYEELKLFLIIYESLTADLTRAFLQMDRLTEENSWLKDELNSLQNKIWKTNKCILIKNIDMCKSKYIYQMRLVINENDEFPQLESTFFNLLEFENDHFENFKCKQSNVISNKIRCISAIIKEYVCQDQFDIAITLCKQSINDIQQINKEHPDIAILLCMLGFLYKDLQKWNDAADCIFDALKIREKIYGPESAIVASTLNNLAIILTGNNKYFEAESLCRKSLEIREKLFGSNHESVAKQMNNLGLLLINIGLYSEGESLFHKALDIYINLKNSELYFLKTSTNLANLYVKRDEYNKAEQQLKINLETIYKYRFKSSDNIVNIIKIYEDQATKNLDVAVQNCLISDQYLVAEIVNVKFLIRLYEKESKRSNCLKLKNCLINLSMNLIECEEEVDVLADFIHQKSSFKKQILEI